MLSPPAYLRVVVKFLLKKSSFSFDHPVSALFDFSASHLVISTSIVESMHLNTCMVEDPIIVSNPICGSAHLSLVCKDLRYLCFWFHGLWVDSRHGLVS